MILDLARQGLTVTAISRRTGHDRKTIRKYIARGLEPPNYQPRAAGPGLIRPFEAYLRERLERFPELTGRRLWRELGELGFAGGYSTVTEFLRAIRPAPVKAFERRFETPPGKQGQVDFAFFKTEFTDEPGVERIVWLFSLVLGHSRMMWARFVFRQDLATVLRCHVAAFEALGGVPEQILYDRMKTAVMGERTRRRRLQRQAPGPGHATTAACRRPAGPIGPRRRARWSGRSAMCARTSSWPAASATSTISTPSSRQWLDAGGQPPRARHHPPGRRRALRRGAARSCSRLPAGPFSAVLTWSAGSRARAWSRVGGNLYSVPDSTRRRIVEVQVTASEVRILEDGERIAAHPVLEGRGRRRIAEGHRTMPAPVNSRHAARWVQRHPRRAANSWRRDRWPSTTPSAAGWPRESRA